MKMVINMQRYFAVDKDLNISDKDKHHIINVMRMKINDKIEIVYDEKVYLCEINDISKKDVSYSVKDIIDVNTVVGTPLFLEDGTMIVPITKVAMGFVAGGGEYSQNIPPKNAQKEYPFAGGSTAGFSVTPVGFLIGKSGNLKLVSVDNQSKFEEVCKLFKDISKNLKK